MIAEVRNNLPSWCYNSSGSVLFDLSNDTKFAESYEAGALSEFDSIKGSGVLGFDLPRSKKNDLILSGYGVPSVIGADQYLLLGVLAFKNGRPIRQNRLRVLQNSDATKAYETELVDSSTFWKDQLSSVRLCDLDLGSFILSRANLQSNWANDSQYTANSGGVWFPLVHYGNWQFPATYNEDDTIDTTTTSTPSDFRPWFHVLYLLEKLFCKIGWKFRSPILETPEWGRRLITYVLANFDGTSGLEGFEFRAATEESYFNSNSGNAVGYPGNPNWLINTDQIQARIDSPPLGKDPAGNPGYYRVDPADPDGAFYHATLLSGVMTFTFDGYIDTTETGDKIIVYPVVSLYNNGVNFANVQGAYQLVDRERKRILYTTPPITMLPDYKVLVSLSTHFIFNPPLGTGLGFYKVESGAVFYNTMESVSLSDGMFLHLPALVNCTYDGSDLFKGVMHLLGGGRLFEDWFNKTLWLFHPNEVTMWDGSKPEAFYKSNDHARTLEVLCNSEKAKISPIKLNRYQRLQFANPKDALVKKRGFSKDNPLHGREIDLGADKGLIEKRKVRRNPFFEPTAMYYANDIPGTSGHWVEIPAIWDNDDFEFTNESGPRIALALGLVRQIQEEDSNGVRVYGSYLFENISTIDIPLAVQYTTHLLEINGVASYLDRNVVYGEQEIDLYQFWREWLREQLQGLTLEYLAYIGNNFVDSNDFRTPYLIFYSGRWSLVKLSEISDFRPCEKLSTPISVIPAPNDQNPC